MVGEHGCGEDKADIHIRGARAWHVAKVSIDHAKHRIIVCGPRMAWHYIENGSFNLGIPRVAAVHIVP